MPTISKMISIRTVSEANRTGEHWSVKHKRHKAQKTAVTLSLKPEILNVKLPCEIHFMRIATRFLDDDNLVSSFKWIRDSMAKLLNVDDASEYIKWHYDQEKGDFGKYAILITIEWNAN